MKSGARVSPFASLSSPNSKKIPIYCWVVREFCSRRMAKPSLELTPYGDFLHHRRAALTTRSRRLSLVIKAGCINELCLIPINAFASTLNIEIVFVYSCIPSPESEDIVLTRGVDKFEVFFVERFS